METAENKTIQRRIIEEVINRKNLDLADELFSEPRPLFLNFLSYPQASSPFGGCASYNERCKLRA